MGESASGNLSELSFSEFPEFDIENIREEIVSAIQDTVGETIYDDRTKALLLQKLLGTVYDVISSKKHVNKYVVKVAVSQKFTFGLTSVMSALWDKQLDQVMTINWTNATTRVMVIILKFNVL